MATLSETISLLASDATNGYGPSPIPSAIDEEVRNLLNAVFPAGGNIRSDIIAALAEHNAFVLIAFAERMAAYAVRTSQGQFIQEGLKALSVAWRLIYFKEVLPALALLYHAAHKVGLDVQQLFTTVPSTDAQFQSTVKGFGNRSESDRSIESMGYVEAQDQDGFRFNRTW